MYDYHTLKLKPRKRSFVWQPAHDQFLRDNRGVDPVLLAQDLKRPLRNTLKRMRELGLRQFSHARRG